MSEQLPKVVERNNLKSSVNISMSLRRISIRHQNLLEIK